LQCRKDPNVHRIGAVARRSRSDGATQTGEGLQKDSTVDAYIQGDQAYVGSFPNEVYSTIIPFLLGGAAVPVQIIWLAAVVVSYRRR
jgi:hypothetical protein